MKRISVLMAAILICALLCAFSIIPTAEISNKEMNVHVRYTNIHCDGSLLTLDADFESFGENFEIAKDIVVATDSAFTNVLKFKSCEVDNGLYRYTFVTEGAFDKVYIKNPIVYVPVTVEETSVSLLPTEKTLTASIENAPWFSITTVETGVVSSAKVEKTGEKNIGMEQDAEEVPVSAVRILIQAENDLLPRTPMLHINGSVVGGTSILSFDKNMNFEGGEFIFSVPQVATTTLTDELSDASLVVSNALRRVDSATKEYVEVSVIND